MELVCPRSTRAQLVRQLGELGVARGDIVMVHASLRAVGPILGGPDELIAAILEVVEETGTMMVYVGDLSPFDDLGRGLYTDEEERFIHENCPAFDPQSSRASRDFGALAELFRTYPGVRCSEGVGARMAALGAHADELLRDHALDYGLGEGSPLARLCELGGKVLLLGSDLDNTTLLHYAEAVAPIEDKRIVRTLVPLLRGGERVWVKVEEFDSSAGIKDWPERFFASIVTAFVAQGQARSGAVGGAQSLLKRGRELVEFAVPMMVETARALEGDDGS
jgi:aminoglycoside 3-N-acetyltransferase